MSAELTALQARAVAILAAAPYFADIAVAELTDGSLESRLQQSLFARGLKTSDETKPVKLGLCCVVGVHAASISTSKRLRIEPLLRVAVLENPLLNRAAGGANKHILDVCVEVFRALHEQPARSGVGFQEATHRFLAVEGNALEIIGQDARRALYGVEGGNAMHCHFTVGGIPL